MKEFYHIKLLLVFIFLLNFTACAKITNTFSGQGTGEITDLGNGKFDILAAGGFSGSRSDTYAKWDRTAKLACNGGSYTIIEREWQSAEYPGLLGGIIQCDNKSTNKHQEQNFTKSKILCVQNKLNQEGYNVGIADGILGKKTKTAIRNYQESMGISPTGVLDIETLNNLGCDESN